MIQKIVDKQCWYFTAYLNEILKLGRFSFLPELEEPQAIVRKLRRQPSRWAFQLFILDSLLFIGFLQFDVFCNVYGKNLFSLKSKLTNIIAKDTKYLLESSVVIEHGSMHSWLKF